MIDSLEEKMKSLVLSESEKAAKVEWTDSLNNFNVPFHNYRGTHVIEVVRIAKYLAKATSADYDVVVMAAWLHDVAKPGTSGQGGHHGVNSARIARDFLINEGVAEDAIVRVCDAIQKHVGLTLDEPVEPLEAQIIWDADKLTKLGLTWIIHQIINGLRYEPNQDFDEILELLKKGLPLSRKIAASMNTEPGKVIANYRIRNIELFIDMLEDELSLKRFI